MAAGAGLPGEVALQGPQLMRATISACEKGRQWKRALGLSLVAGEATLLAVAHYEQLPRGHQRLREQPAVWIKHSTL